MPKVSLRSKVNLRLLTDISDETQERMPELVPWFVLWPDEQNTGDGGRYKVMQPPPTLDPGAVDLQDALTNSEGAVIPY